MLVGFVALAGCSWLPSFSSKPTEPCPSAVILRPLAKTAVFGPAPERRPDNVAFYGMLSEADLKCEYTGDAMQMNLDVIVVGERGPAAKGDVGRLQLFRGGDRARSIDPQQDAVRRCASSSTRRKSAPGVTDHIEETIPLGGRKGTDLTVDLGFQQSPEVVDFYKHFRGR